MARENNFLLGKGEILTETVSIASMGGPKDPPYDIPTAKRRIAARLETVQTEAAELPPDATPRGEVVAVMTLHPRYVSKSDYPTELLEETGLRAIGSRPRRIRPEAWGIKKHPEEATTQALFVAGSKAAFARWAETVQHWPENLKAAEQLVRIEDLALFHADEKLKSIPEDEDQVLLEVVVQDSDAPGTIDQFRRYVTKVGGEPVMERAHTEGSLSFIPVVLRGDDHHGVAEMAEELAKFSFVRVARSMPELRPIEEDFFFRDASDLPFELPEDGPLDPDVRVAVFDGGILNSQHLSKWVSHFDKIEAGNATIKGQLHGLAVTSAVLFGPILPNVPIDRPYFLVDHYRVTGDNNGKPTNFLILDVLDRIVEVLDTFQGRYQFVNLSLGPRMAAEDDEVTLWTARLDKIFARDNILATVAVGNDGKRDAASGLNRIQPPSDGVNTLSVGASDTMDPNWNRALYSCVGPGRCPGIVKPDGMAFGGTQEEPFWVLANSSATDVRPVGGTSFAAPYVLRAAAGVRAQLGDALSPLAIKALMIQRARRGDRDQHQVGWGLFETNVGRLITCEDDEALVVYQGHLPVSSHLRCWLPIPPDTLSGKVTLSATLVVAPDTDPEYPYTYTRDGLEVFFRRDHEKRKINPQTGKEGKHAPSDSFFSQGNMYSGAEYELREDSHKWEPVLNHSQTMMARTLNRPVFDIYYHNRDSATKRVQPAKPLPYALVVGVKAPAVPDLYNKIFRSYANVLQPLKPVVAVPIQIR